NAQRDGSLKGCSNCVCTRALWTGCAPDVRVCGRRRARNEVTDAEHRAALRAAFQAAVFLADHSGGVAPSRPRGGRDCAPPPAIFGRALRAEEGNATAAGAA